MLLLAAVDAAPGPVAHVGVGWRMTQYPLLYEGIPWRQALEGTAALRFPAGIEAGLSARLTFPAAAEPDWALDVGANVEGVATIGRWRPAAGLELGSSTRHTSAVLETERPPGSYFSDLGTPEPLWLDFTATPLRFGFGSWEVGVARTSVGVSLLHFGMSGRASVQLVSVTRTL